MHTLFLIAAVCIAIPFVLCIAALLYARLWLCAVEWVLFKAARTVRRITLVCVLCLGALISSPPCATAAGTVFLEGKGLADGFRTPAFLASAEATDSEAGQWLRVGFYILGSIGGMAVTWASLFRRKPSLDAELTKFATQEDIKSVRAEMHATERRIEDKILHHFQELDRKRSVSIGNLHERITTTADTLRNEISDLPREVIKLLRDTGNIGKGGPK